MSELVYEIDLDPYYPDATQCRFYNGNEWKNGIVIYDFAIESQTGEIYLASDCARAAKDAGEEDWIVEYEWLPLKI